MFIFESWDNKINNGINFEHLSSLLDILIINFNEFEASFNKSSFFLNLNISSIKGIISFIITLYPFSLCSSFKRKFCNLLMFIKKDVIISGLI